MKKLKYILILIFAVVYSNCSAMGNFVEIDNGKIKVSIDLEIGGRITEYSLNGNNVLFVRNGENTLHSDPYGGRCDFGPEKLVPPRPETWLGSWELVEKKSNYIKIKSQVAQQAGVQLIREFTL